MDCRRPAIPFLVIPFVLGLILFSAAAEAKGEEELWSIRVNCGGDSLTTVAGVGFSRDVPFTSGLGYGYDPNLGQQYHTWHLIGGTPDNDLYKNARHNFGTYFFEVPNGQYRVRLHFADLQSHHPATTTIDVTIEGTLEMDHVDLFDRAERDYAIPYQFLTTVTDGLLEIEALGYYRSQLNAIEVIEAVPHTTPPQTPVLTQAIGSYRAVILNFEDNPEAELAGYRVWRQVAAEAFVLVTPDLNQVSRFIDKTVVPGTLYNYEVEAVDVYGNVSPRLTGIAVTPLDLGAGPTTVFHIAADSSDLAAIAVDPYNDLYIPVTVTVNDTVYTGVQLRYRGNVTRTLLKKSYKLKFPANQLFRGEAIKINLNSSYTDPTLIRERLAYSFFRDAGIPTPTIEPVLVMINDHNIGISQATEQVDEYFLDNHNLESNTLIYKAGDKLDLLDTVEEYMETYTKETLEDGESWDDIIALIELLNNTPADEMYEALASTFDIQNFLDYYRAIIISGGWDFVYKNYYLAHNLETDLWQIYPWDQDLTFGPLDLWGVGQSHTQSITGGQANRLIAAMLSVPVLKNLHLCGTEAICHGDFSDDAILPRVQTAYDDVIFDGERDWRKREWEDNTKLYGGYDELTQWVALRNDYLILLAGIYFDEPEDLVINEVLAANATTLPDEFGEFDDWIELYNPSGSTLSLAGTYLTDDLQDPYKFALPDTVLAANEYLIVWADDDGWQGPLHANFKLSRNGDQVAIHRMGTHVEAVDLVFFGPQGTDLTWGRLEDGLCPFDYLDSATPGSSNNPLVGTEDFPEDYDGAGESGLSLSLAPNPSRTGTLVRLAQSSGDDVTISIHDVQGRRLRTLFQGQLTAGIHDWAWNGEDEFHHPVPAGTYWIRATTGTLEQVTQFVRLR